VPLVAVCPNLNKLHAGCFHLLKSPGEKVGAYAAVLVVGMDREQQNGASLVFLVELTGHTANRSLLCFHDQGVGVLPVSADRHNHVCLPLPPPQVDEPVDHRTGTSPHDRRTGLHAKRESLATDSMSWSPNDGMCRFPLIAAPPCPPLTARKRDGDRAAWLAKEAPRSSKE